MYVCIGDLPCIHGFGGTVFWMIIETKLIARFSTSHQVKRAGDGHNNDVRDDEDVDEY
jgi:hypothetical protein